MLKYSFSFLYTLKKFQLNNRHHIDSYFIDIRPGPVSQTDLTRNLNWVSPIRYWSKNCETSENLLFSVLTMNQFLCLKNSIF